MRVFCAMVVLGSLASATSAPAKGDASVRSAPGAANGPSPQASRSTSSPRSSGGRLLGTAFRTKGGGSEVVLQISTEVEIETRASSSGATYLLKRCRILRHNDRRPLDTRFFDSPVTGVTVRERGPDIEVDVSLRDATGTQPRQPRKEQGPGSSWYWVLSFPRPTTARQAPASAAGGATAAANP